MAVKGKVLIIEDDRAICTFMRRVLEANGFETVIVHTGKDGISIAASHCPDVVILDPPRAGIHPDVAKVILEAAPDRIVYVSCNPASQARDLAVICEKYRITAVQPVDMFPHTHHVENVVALERTVRKEI